MNRGQPWHHPSDVFMNLVPLGPEERLVQRAPQVEGYSQDQARRLKLALDQLVLGWLQNDADTANVGIAALATVLPAVDAQAYPTRTKRVTELWYNRTFKGTVANVFLYFVAMTLFLVAAVGVAPKLRKPAMWIFSAAVIVHILSMAIRFWLAERWPTQNQFESILGAALFGCIAGWFLELWKKNSLFGMAFAFVGFLAMTACMASPFFGANLGGDISKTAGILQTYWLYIHVNIVICSYALIAAAFVMGAVYLLQRQWYWINPLEPGSDDSANGGAGPLAPAGGVSTRETYGTALQTNLELQSVRTESLAVLDQANMVILQMAFWFLGIGILCGAVWADHSWGRPWGWDPKETFALITWIVYLIIVHIRVVAPKVKADTTAWLAILGFGVMMFNWVGVNFFLAGLHSYA
jgi:cytochrome c-type biogenesis protein CcsB